MPVPPEVMTTSTFSPIAANSARLDIGAVGDHDGRGGGDAPLR